MPQRRASSEPPKVMTWPKASLVLVVALVFDLVRAFFTFFWFLGPALAAVYCTVTASDALSSWTFGLLGTGAAATICAAVAAGAAAAAVAVTAPFGVVMAMAIGFAGWLTIGGYLMITNARIFKENGIWFVASLAVSEVPFLDAIPALTLTLWRMYSRQIKLERAAMKKYREEKAAEQQRERNQQAMRVAQIQAAQQTQFMQQAAANDERFNQEQAANDASYDEIPDEVRKAA